MWMREREREREREGGGGHTLMNKINKRIQLIELNNHFLPLPFPLLNALF